MIFFKKFSKELINGFFISIVFKLMYIIGNYLFIFLTTNIYGIVSLGYFTIIETFLMLTSVFSRLGLDTASIRFISKSNSNKSYNSLLKYYKISFFLILFMSLLVAFFSYFSSNYIADKINKPEIEYILRISSIFIIPFSLLFLNSESFRGMKNILYYSLFDYSNIYIISTVIIVLFYFLNLDVNIFRPIYIFFFSLLILFKISMISWIFNIKKLSSQEFNSKNDDKNISIKNILKISYPMLITNSMGYLLKWIGIIVLSIYSNVEEIGLYSIAVKISMIVTVALYSINSIAAPKISELYTQNKMNELKNIIHQSSRLIFFLTFPILIIVLFFDSTLLYTFGIDSNSIDQTKNILFILLVGQFSNAISGSTGFILQMTDKQNTYKNIMFSFVILNIFLNFILVPNYGMMGAAISSSVCVVLWNILCVIFIYRYYKIISLYPLLELNK